MHREFQSEIRDSEINQLLEKVDKRNYGKYLIKLTMQTLRGFRDSTVRFDFPVTAIVGPNGGGKTTVLGAAGLIYKAVRPRRFFAKSGRFDGSMQDWAIEYELLDRSVSPRDTISRTASYKNARWSRNSELRDVAIFGVSRTVPSTERVELTRYASNDFDVDPDRISQLEPEVTQHVSRVLGKDISAYRQLHVDEKGRVTLLTGQSESGVNYSEFHFGAGESSVIRMVRDIEALPENSLILIEEIENGLHPIATIRMTEYLIDVALRKKCQTIFTTHSNDALAPLPDRAIWVAMGNRVYQGKLDIHSLRAITGQVDAQLAIFVEDIFASDWVQAAMRTDATIDLGMVEVHQMEGDGTAVAINEHHNSDPSSQFPSICYIDGDSLQHDDPDQSIFRLPGESPETLVFDQVLEYGAEFVGALSVSLHQPFNAQDRVLAICQEARKTTRDEHTLFSKIGQRLGFLSESVVRSAFLSVWCQAYPAEVDRILQPIRSCLPN